MLLLTVASRLVSRRSHHHISPTEPRLREGRSSYNHDSNRGVLLPTGLTRPSLDIFESDLHRYPYVHVCTEGYRLRCT